MKQTKTKEILYIVKQRTISDNSEEENTKVVYDVFDEEGESIYIGCDYETAEKYMNESINK